MSGTEASWVPWVMGGASGIGGYLAGGGDDDKIAMTTMNKVAMTTRLR